MVDYWDSVPGINGSGKGHTMDEGSGMDSSYLLNSLGMLIDDFKSGEPEEKKIVPVLKWVRDRVNQSIPDGDVEKSDIKDFLTEPSGRKYLKKSGMSAAETISMIMDF
jgi:hypothetical protein